MANHGDKTKKMIIPEEERWNKYLFALLVMLEKLS
jgi:hypothetical protein